MSTENSRFKKYSTDLAFDYLFTGKFPKLVRGNSKIHGEGIIAQEDIKQGMSICPLFGVLYDIKKAKIDYPKYSYQISDDAAIETINEPGFLNHSCNPNAYINKSWIFEAIIDIKKGQEIVVDYGTVDYFNYEFTCNCGEVSCRKKFYGTISSKPEYQMQMGKYFSPYLKDRFVRIAPNIFRQRFMIDLITNKNLTKEVVEKYLAGIANHLGLRSYGGPMVYETGGQGKTINQGYDGFIALVDSGISVSTWRDARLVAVYIHTCKAFSAEEALNYTKNFFDAGEFTTKHV